MIDKEPALTDSLCTCMLGGVISIVDNLVSMGGIGAQSVKPKSDVGSKPEIGIKETTPPNSMHHAHNGDEASSDLKSSTELIDRDGKRGDNVIYEENNNTSFIGKLRGQDVTVTDVYVRDISYIKCSSSESNNLREDFNKTNILSLSNAIIKFYLKATILVDKDYQYVNCMKVYEPMILLFERGGNFIYQEGNK